MNPLQTFPVYWWLLTIFRQGAHNFPTYAPSHVFLMDSTLCLIVFPNRILYWSARRTQRNSICYCKNRRGVVDSKNQIYIKKFLLEGISFKDNSTMFCHDQRILKIEQKRCASILILSLYTTSVCWPSCHSPGTLLLTWCPGSAFFVLGSNNGATTLTKYSSWPLVSPLIHSLSTNY